MLTLWCRCLLVFAITDVNSKHADYVTPAAVKEMVTARQPGTTAAAGDVRHQRQPGTTAAPGDVRHQCQLCRLSFSDEFVLIDHMSVVHKKQSAADSAGSQDHKPLRSV